jgi:ferredoxin
MRVVVDFDRCASRGECVKACPEVFELRNDGFLYILNEEPPESLRAAVQRAAEHCPTAAITVEE